jgi:hypothetical protein
MTWVQGSFIHVSCFKHDVAILVQSLLASIEKCYEEKATSLYKWGVGGMTIHMGYIKM